MAFNHMELDGLVWALLIKAAVIAIGIILFAFVGASFLYRSRVGVWSAFWKRIERSLYIPFGIVWLCGFAVYCVGMYIIPGEESAWHKLINVAPMAIVHAFGMFILESDVSEVQEELHDNLLYMTCFSLAHFAAALVSMVFVIKHFGYNMIASVRLWFSACGWFNSLGWFKKDKLFVFWGMNESSFYLAKDIKRVAEGKFTYRMVFVNTSDDEENTGSRTGLERLFNFLSIKNKELDNYKELGCLSVNAFNRLSKCELSESERRNHTGVLADKLGLKSLVNLFAKTSKEVHVFMLGDDEASNIEASANLCCDKDLNAFASITESQKSPKDHEIICGSGTKKIVKIYCHARYDSINRVVEDSNSRNNVEVKIVDSSHDSINELKSVEAYHPVNYVDVDVCDNVGTIKSGFDCMVVGFGETGQDAAKFLYEFGSFVSSNSSKDDDIPEDKKSSKHVYKADFFCRVIDHKMINIKGRVLSSVPALSDKSQFEYSNCDVNSQRFYDILEKSCDTLNYVVVALGNDEMNITVAVRIFNYVRKRRSQFSNFRIFVRCHSTMHEHHLRAIANHYNEVDANESAACCEHITIFGTLSAIYSYNQIVENDYENDGKEYNHMYCEASGNKGKKDIWESRHEHFLSLRTIDGYSELRRKECQDIANAYHSLTKLAIMRKVIAANPEKTESLRSCLEGNMKAVPLFGRKQPRGCKVEGRVVAKAEDAQVSFTSLEQLLFRNIARLEHFRWNASHEALGYQHYSCVEDIDSLVSKKQQHKCNERYRLHNCILPWEELDEESDNAWWWKDDRTKETKEYPDYKLYDFIVITTTLKLHSQKTAFQRYLPRFTGAKQGNR